MPLGQVIHTPIYDLHLPKKQENVTSYFELQFSTGISRLQLFDLKNYIDRQLIASPDSIFVAFAVGIFAIAAISVPFGLVSEIADIIGRYLFI